MSSIIVSKSDGLKGSVSISGAKNAALPIIAASLAIDDKVELKNIPDLSDTRYMTDLIRCFGAEASFFSNTLTINSKNINNLISPYDLVTKFRASFLVAGPLLAKYGYVRISLPGGCQIGTRPVDLHIKGFTQMGAECGYGQGFMEFKAKKLKGASIYLDFPSVGATENLMIAATLANGDTEIVNAATEPEVCDLANFLVSSGADIEGIGTEHLYIRGVDKLNSCSYTIIPDRIECGTFMIASACTGGEITINNVCIDHINPIIAKLKEMDVNVIEDINKIKVVSKNPLKPVDIKTMPHPGFPTDMQSLFSVLMCYAHGTSMITETVFENRFMHLKELMRMNASIKIDGRCAIVDGKGRLEGAKVWASDLRSGAALAVAGLRAEGTTEISNSELILRGYENFVQKLSSLGANIGYI